MKAESAWDRRIAPLPWHRAVIGENSIGEPVAVVRDAQNHAVAEYLAVGDADLIVLCVNLSIPPNDNPTLKPRVTTPKAEPEGAK